jgi:tRNA threonylcarbamoyladenosine biosynthesis protein TsaB
VGDLVLAIDTSTSQVGVALGSGESVVAEVRLVGQRRHAEQLNPAIDHVLEQAGRSLSELAMVAVGVGPGLFTGLRVGVTTAKVVAQVVGCPVVPVSSLDLVARPLAMTGEWVAVVADARRGEVYSAVYAPGCEKVAEDAVTSPEDALARFPAEAGKMLVVGTGVSLLPERPGLVDAGAAFAHPSPAALVTLASQRWERRECCAAEEVQPVYLRQSDAELGWGAS